MARKAGVSLRRGWWGWSLFREISNWSCSLVHDSVVADVAFVAVVNARVVAAQTDVVQLVDDLNFCSDKGLQRKVFWMVFLADIDNVLKRAGLRDFRFVRRSVFLPRPRVGLGQRSGWFFRGRSRSGERDVGRIGGQ